MKYLGLICILCVLCVWGCSSSAPRTAEPTTTVATAPPMAEHDYLVQMKGLSDTFASLENNAQTLTQQAGKDPQALLDSLTHIEDEKSDYIKKLQALMPPDKYKEFHQTLVEWRTKEFEVEHQMLQGIVQYSKDHAKATADKLDKLSAQDDEIGKTYEAKTIAIAKAHGFDSVDKYLAIPAP